MTTTATTMADATSSSVWFDEQHGIYRSCKPALDLSAAPTSLVDFFHRQTAEFDDKLALVDASDRNACLTFAQLKSRAAAVAAALREAAPPRPTVLILSPNSIHFMEIFLGVVAAGGIVTTVNPLNTAQEIRKQARDSRPVLVFTVDKLLDKVEALQLPIVLIGEGSSKSRHGSSNIVSYESLLQRGGELRAAAAAAAAPVAQDDTAALLYSSGTTGVSKGVMLSHRNFIAVSKMLEVEAEMEGRKRGAEVQLCMLPMFHIFGLAASTFAALQHGDTVVIMSRFDFVELLRVIDEFRITLLPTVPPIAIALAKHPIVDRHKLTSLHTIISGAAPLGKDIVVAIRKRLPWVDIRQGYGLTESSGISLLTLAHDARSSGSAGSLVAGVEAKVVECETGKWQPPNKRGELWVRGPHIMKGYFGNPSATAATLDDEGWLHTGDLVYFNDIGYAFVVDRIKELIKYKGFQVAPAELEALLLSHPQILDAAVVPLPDDEAGEVPVAYVVRKPGCPLQEAAVLKFVSDQVAPYKKLRQAVFIDVIPKSAAGKILRRELTQRTSRL